MPVELSAPERIGALEELLMVLIEALPPRERGKRLRRAVATLRQRAKVAEMDDPHSSTKAKAALALLRRNALRLAG